MYVAGGSLYLLDGLDPAATAREVDVRIGGARSSLQPKRVKAAGHLGTISPDPSGRASAVETRGTVHLLTHRDGPVRALADGSGVRRRLPVVLGDTLRVAWVTDVAGDDAIEVVSTDDIDAAPAVVVAAGKVGRVLALAASPDGRTRAIASHDGKLRAVTVPDAAGVPRPGRRGAGRRSAATRARVRVVDVETINGDIQSPVFSPDSRWLALVRTWRRAAAPHPHGRRLGWRGQAVRRHAPPVHRHRAGVHHRRSAPRIPFGAEPRSGLRQRGVRPFVPQRLPALPGSVGRRRAVPFDPQLGGRPFGDAAAGSEPDGEVGSTVAALATKASRAKVAKSADGGTDGRGAKDGTDVKEPTRVDVEGLDQRLVPVPVAGRPIRQHRAVKGGLVWLTSHARCRACSATTGRGSRTSRSAPRSNTSTWPPGRPSSSPRRLTASR